MLDFRLRVFYTVAKMLNFTKAAGVLNITQPAVTKHIKELEQSYKVTLFDRQPNALSLTEAGRLLYKHAVIIIEHYDLLEFDMGALNNKIIGELRIGASTTIAQYILPTVLAGFYKRYPDIQIRLINENSTHIQQLLMDKTIDIGFIEGKANNSNLHFMPYLNDELVLVCGQKNKALKSDSIDILELYKLPLVMREGDSGTYEIIQEQLNNAGIRIHDLQVQMHFGSTESIKLFLEHSDHFAIVSLQAIKRELAFNQLKIISIHNVVMERVLHIALRQGQPSPVVAPFLKFIRSGVDNL